MTVAGSGNPQRRETVVRTLAALGLAVLWVATVACGGASMGSRVEDGDRPVLKMRHQILFQHREDAHVFEGYMILKKDAFFVKAFAGPGVDLFTLAREGAWHREELHIASLADTIDLELVSDSIARVYLGACVGASPSGRVSCDFHGEEMTEHYNAEGQLARRVFPNALSRQLVIDYQEYSTYFGRALPRKIQLVWHEGEITMVIRLVACEIQEEVDPGLWTGSDR